MACVSFWVCHQELIGTQTLTDIFEYIILFNLALACQLLLVASLPGFRDIALVPSAVTGEKLQFQLHLLCMCRELNEPWLLTDLRISRYLDIGFDWFSTYPRHALLLSTNTPLLSWLTSSRLKSRLLWYGTMGPWSKTRPPCLPLFNHCRKPNYHWPTLVRDACVLFVLCCGTPSWSSAVGRTRNVTNMTREKKKKRGEDQL